jgi:hypothetical protein
MKKIIISFLVLPEQADQTDDNPAEIVVTVIDDDAYNRSDPNSPSGEVEKTITNFSLFLVPSTYRKCSSGYLRSHDKKCKLIVKLRRKFVG